MTLHLRLIYFAFIYLTSNNKWILVESSGSTSPGTGTQEGTSVTTPSAGGTDSSNKTGINLNIDTQCSTDKFQCNKNGLRRTYTPKDNYAFKRVGHYIGGECVDVWSETDSKNYSSKVDVDLMNNQPKLVTVHLDNTTKLFEKKSDDKSWQEIDTSKVNPRSLNIKYQHESYFCTNVVQGTTRTFTAKTGFAFKLVYEFIDKKTRPEIWKTDKESEYALKVVVEGGNKLTIYIGSGGSTKVFKKDSDNKWTEDTAASIKSCDTGNSEGTKTCVELSLKAKEATNEFDYKKDGNVVTYTAKDKYGFKSVKTGKNGDIVVWSTDNASEYATKVVLNGKGKKQKDVTIHLPNDAKKVFKRDGKDKPWSEVSQQTNQATGQPGSGTAASGATS